MYFESQIKGNLQMHLLNVSQFPPSCLIVTDCTCVCAGEVIGPALLDMHLHDKAHVVNTSDCIECFTYQTHLWLSQSNPEQGYAQLEPARM